MTTPTTPAGRALPKTKAAKRMHNQSFHVKGCTGCPMNDSLAAIEAEARADLLDRLAAGVRELPDEDPVTLYYEHADREDAYLLRAAVLSLIEEARK